MKRVFILLGVLLPLSSAAQQLIPFEEGSPYHLEHFESQDYGSHSQNWEVVEDERGLIYIANTHGILEYDGQGWRRILLPDEADQAVRSLALTSGGIIFAGGGGEIGYLAPDEVGQLHYVSLLPWLLEDDHDFADVWTTHASDEGVFFQSFSRLIRWDGERMRVWRSDTRFHKAFQVAGVLYVREEGVGLMRVEGDELKLVPGGESFAWESVYAVLPHSEGLLVGTRTQGFFVLSERGARSFATQADPYLRTYRPYNATVLGEAEGRAEGLYLVTSFGGGVLLLSPDGELVRIYRDDAGIAADDLVLNATLDRQEGLWLALNDGVRRVDILTPLTRFDLVHGLEGNVYDLVRHDGVLYAGTSTGLYRLLPGAAGVGDAGQPRYARFEQITGVSEQVWAVLSDPLGLLVATNDGVYLLTPDGERVLRSEKAFALYRSPSDPSRLYVGLKDGLAVMEREGGRWVERFTVEGLGEIRSMEETPDGKLWVAPLLGGLERLTWNPEAPSEPEVEAFGERDGLPGGILGLRILHGRIAVSSLEGVYRIREGGRPSFRKIASFDEALGDRELNAYTEGSGGGVWVYGDDTLTLLMPDGTGGYTDATPAVLRLRTTGIHAIYEEPDGTVWMGGEGGLLRYDPRIEKGYEVPYSAQIRAVRGRPSDLLFGGAFGDGHLVAQQTDGDFLVLPYERNGLRFEYAAPAYNYPAGTTFQYRLEGFDESWSAWSHEDHTEFTNLPEHRRYQFRVRARNAQGVLSEEAVFAFEVRPPWYRTWWAYAFYVLAFGGVLWGFSAWRLQAHRRDLEEQRMVNQRLDRMNVRLADTNERLRRADKLKDDLLANTSHELRTPLTAILGFSAVLEEEGTDEQRELASAIHRNGQRLLDTVNGLLDMAKLQANLLELRPAALDAAEVAGDVLDMLRPLAEERGLYLRLMPEGLAVPFVTDRYALERILINLVSNALKFTDQGGVTVLLDGDEEAVRLVIRDTGIGMEEEFLPHLFDAFKQASTGYGRSHEGTGLGLTIVRRVVELLGGRINVESRLGEGTTFEVVLPRLPSGGDGAAHVRRASSPTVLDGARVLALAESEAVRQGLEAILGDGGGLVLAEDAAAAVREARAVPFDAVLVEHQDHRSEDGCAVVGEIRALPGYAHTPVILLGDAACDVPPDHVLALPIDPGQLLHLLEALLTRVNGPVASSLQKR
ncbi:MAG: ATP-binding protein [Rubricoccaceae bacterium]|nr:ATP-binding protein [Rubricoccaceae bacterium]